MPSSRTDTNPVYWTIPGAKTMRYHRNGGILITSEIEKYVINFVAKNYSDRCNPRLRLNIHLVEIYDFPVKKLYKNKVQILYNQLRITRKNLKSKEIIYIMDDFHNYQRWHKKRLSHFTNQQI